MGKDQQLRVKESLGTATPLKGGHMGTVDMDVSSLAGKWSEEVNIFTQQLEYGLWTDHGLAVAVSQPLKRTELPGGEAEVWTLDARSGAVFITPEQIDGSDTGGIVSWTSETEGLLFGMESNRWAILTRLNDVVSL
jgi:hypothetical protein